ncbi:MAG: alpha/beta hydrolase [Pseudobdellovibrionaceae bacterium]
MKSEIIKNLCIYDTHNFSVETLRIESAILKNNPLKDSNIRFNPILIPKSNEGPWPVVIVLSGFTGNAPFYFNSKFNEQNAVQVIDKAHQQGEAPEALYLFVDALTSWGGSQFINSAATGDYENYLMKELIPTLRKKYPVSMSARDWCITGGSSGGYGALHLGSKYPDIFGLIGAIAPDCFFEASLLPELYHALPLWDKYQQSGRKALEDLRNGKLTKHRNWHTLLNAFGMAACYCPKGADGDFQFPLDVRTGEKIPDLWQRWLNHDPVHFLLQRIENLKSVHGIYLDVGSKDNFHLQYGTRQISNIFRNNKIDHEYVEFDGNHFDIGDRRIEVWKWLCSRWRT